VVPVNATHRPPGQPVIELAAHRLLHPDDLSIRRALLRARGCVHGPTSNVTYRQAPKSNAELDAPTHVEGIDQAEVERGDANYLRRRPRREFLPSHLLCRALADVPMDGRCRGACRHYVTFTRPNPPEQAARNLAGAVLNAEPESNNRRRPRMPFAVEKERLVVNRAEASKYRMLLIAKRAEIP
jgi:hypothetical protein